MHPEMIRLLAPKFRFGEKNGFPHFWYWSLSPPLATASIVVPRQKVSGEPGLQCATKTAPQDCFWYAILMAANPEGLPTVL